MRIGRVIGSVVSTIKQPAYENSKLILVEELNLWLKPTGEVFLAMDTVGAGDGETVLVVEEGRAARQILGVDIAPVRTLIVGIIDRVEIQNEGP
ncbi:MAG TPA: hypothetical protein EYP85_04045 [Armatimonadetes bacterium]|nr:hypothetical protein [Armatimonadota bacterium]